MPDGMSAEGAMALPTPAPLSGPLFANVADMPVKSLVGHAEMGLSKLTGLAGLVNKHQHLKYVAAAGVLVVLVIVVALLSLRGGDGGKDVDKVAEIEKKARAAALAANPIPFAPEQPSADPTPTNPVMDVSKAHAPQAHANNKKVSKPAAPSPSGKPAPAENPLEPPAGMMRSTEKPIPLAAIQGKRVPAANEPKPIPREAIADVIRRKENQAGLKTCYERALKRDGRLRAGRLDITVSIGPMGSVQKVQVHGSADFMIIEGCLKEAIRHWRFPSNSEEYATSFPLILQGG
jgi:outer membrane biosynthesis protein TonB